MKDDQRFTIYPPENMRDYRVSIPRYHGGEVVTAEAYDALAKSHRELYEAAKVAINYVEHSSWQTDVAEVVETSLALAIEDAAKLI
jgi:hypothetical protein